MGPTEYMSCAHPVCANHIRSNTSYSVLRSSVVHAQRRLQLGGNAFFAFHSSGEQVVGMTILPLGNDSHVTAEGGKDVSPRFLKESGSEFPACSITKSQRCALAAKLLGREGLFLTAGIHED